MHFCGKWSQQRQNNTLFVTNTILKAYKLATRIALIFIDTLSKYTVAIIWVAVRNKLSDGTVTSFNRKGCD